MTYYIFENIRLAQEASASIYDLNAPPRDQRTTFFAYGFIAHESNESVIMEWIDLGYNDGDILEGMTPLTPEQAADQGYLIYE